jgi:hypothetical protein
VSKGDRSHPANYRPISLTCILCKTLEHIVDSSISKKLTDLDLFYELKHGFREKRSCESQLLMMVDDLLKSLNSKKQTDLILLDSARLLTWLAMNNFFLNFMVMASEVLL